MGHGVLGAISQLVDIMKSDLRRRFEAGFQGLANLMLQQKAVAEQLLPTGDGEPLIGSIPLSARPSGASSVNLLPCHQIFFFYYPC